MYANSMETITVDGDELTLPQAIQRIARLQKDNELLLHTLHAKMEKQWHAQH